MDWMDLLRKAIDDLEAHLMEKVSAQQLAERLNLSGFYFQKCFKIMTGYTVGEYIRFRRLYLAALDLVAGNDKIIDLAYRYGYETPESFSKAFSRFHGVPPIQIKQKQHKIKTFLPLSVSILVKGGNRLDYVVEPEEGFDVFGITQNFTYGEAYEDIPKFWKEPGTRCWLSQRAAENRAQECWGISMELQESKREFRYLIAEKASGGQIPKEAQTVRIPALTWAKFRCIGPMPGAFQAVNTRIFGEWLPGNTQYAISTGISMERYLAGDITSRHYKSEIWIPVRKIK